MIKKDWMQQLSSYIFIFNVERGLSVFIRSGLNQGFLYDLGSSKEFSPTDFIKNNLLELLDEYEQNGSKHKIAQLVISHPHSDHISEIETFGERDSIFYPVLLTCPHDKNDMYGKDERINWNRINNLEADNEKIEIYKNLYKNRELPLRTIQYKSKYIVPNLEYGIYYVRPPILEDIFPKDDQKYTNSTSIVFYYRHGDHTILIPGDITPEAIENILEEEYGSEKRYTIFSISETYKHCEWHLKNTNQPSLKSKLNELGLSILIAPHHGLESCYSEKLYESIKDGRPSLVIISEKRHDSPQDGEVDNRYQSIKGAKGLNAYIEGNLIRDNYSLTTRNGHHILIIFPGTGLPKIFAEKEPVKLLDKMLISQKYGG